MAFADRVLASETVGVAMFARRQLRVWARANGAPIGEMSLALRRAVQAGALARVYVPGRR